MSLRISTRQLAESGIATLQKRQIEMSESQEQLTSGKRVARASDDRALAEEVGPEFAARLDTIGIDTRLVVWADETRWADLDTGDFVL